MLSGAADRPVVRQRPAELAGLLLPSLGLLPLDLVVAYQLASKVQEQRVKFVKVFKVCQATYSQESVHNARVHSLRLIARLSLVQEAIPSGTADEVLYSLKRSLKK